MDFAADSLFNGRRFSVLKAVDYYSRECLAAEVGRSIKGEKVAAVLNRLKHTRELSASIRIRGDSGGDLVTKTVDKWAYENKVVLDFSRPGKPIDNAFAVSGMNVSSLERLTPADYARAQFQEAA